MGIPSYFSYIVKNHRNIIRKLNKNTKIDYMFLDSNSIIYDCLHKLSNNYEPSKKEEFEIQLINKTIEKIEEYVSIISPSKGVYVSFDGVAPVAKLEQQRTRRHKSLLEYKLNKQLNPKFIETWDKISITPGTQFMNKLNTILSCHFNKKGYLYMFSGSDEVGEGEHKIFQYIRDNNDIMKNKSIVVYGLDADLIMLGINHLDISKKIYLFRETPEFIKSIDSSLIPNENYIIYLNELSNGIVTHMKNFNKANITENVIKDYMFMCFFLGNDFLPHFPAVNIRTLGIHILMNAYKEVLGSSKKTIIQHNKIQWSVLSKIVEVLSENEHDNLLREHTSREKLSKRQYPCKTYEEQMEKYNKIPITNREIEEYINPTQRGWEKRYYDKLIHCDNNKHNVKKICINYLEGIEWTFNYYSGNQIDWNWKYNYHYPPLLKDLKKYIPHWNYDILNIETPKNDINEYIQLAYVLPKEKLHYLPPKYHYKLLENLDEYYLEDYDLEWSYCKYMWEAHPNLPNLSVKTIKDLFMLVN
jgi:5'-3' exonuclease